MNNLISINERQAMSSLELREIVNFAREENGETGVRNNDFLKRIEDELEGELPVTKVSRPPRGGTPQRYYDLTRDQCMLVGMREPKAVRRSVLSKLKGMDKPVRPASNLDALQTMIDTMREQEERVHALESQVNAITKGEAFFTVVGYANRHDMRIDQQPSESSLPGYVDERGSKQEPRRTRYTYPAEVLDMAFDIA